MPTWNSVLVVALILCAAWVRWRASRRVLMPAEESETFNTVGVLDLN